MTRVLLLLESDPGFQTRHSVAMLRAGLGEQFDIQIKSIGRGDIHYIVSVARSLRREKLDVIHAWGMPALFTAAISKPQRIILSPTRFLKSPSLRWLRRVMKYRKVDLVCDSDSQRRAAIDNGIPATQCRVIRPPIETTRLAHRNPEMRAALGLNDDDFVLLAPGESSRSAGHDEAVWATGILNVLDRRFKLLLWLRGDHATAAVRLAVRLRQASMIKLAEPLLNREMDFDELLSVADACLITAKGPVETLPIAMCMAEAIPIVSTVTPLTAELLQNDRTALLVPERSTRLIAQRVLDLHQNPQLATQISRNAVEAAKQHFSVTRVMDQYRSLYIGSDRADRVAADLTREAQFANV